MISSSHHLYPSYTRAFTSIQPRVMSVRFFMLPYVTWTRRILKSHKKGITANCKRWTILYSLWIENFGSKVSQLIPNKVRWLRQISLRSGKDLPRIDGYQTSVFDMFWPSMNDINLLVNSLTRGDSVQIVFLNGPLVDRGAVGLADFRFNTSWILHAWLVRTDLTNTLSS